MSLSALQWLPAGLLALTPDGDPELRGVTPTRQTPPAPGCRPQRQLLKGFAPAPKLQGQPPAPRPLLCGLATPRMCHKPHKTGQKEPCFLPCLQRFSTLLSKRNWTISQKVKI